MNTRAPEGRQQSWSDDASEQGLLVVVTDNPVGRALVELATVVGRRTTLLADEDVELMPVDWLAEHPLEERDAVVLADHDTPDMDGLLRTVLASPAGYVAMLGSRGRAAKVFASLADLPEETRAKLHCPAGLPLGGRAPGEMALSILAQVVAHSHGTAQHIPGVGTVYLAVSDQDRALAFYRDMLGFEVRTDKDFGDGFRWIEVAPAGAYTVIALVPPTGEDDPQPGGQAPFGFDTPNLEAAMAELGARGVEFEDVTGGQGPVPPMAYFRDPDGNRILLVEGTTR